ncbi:MAG: lipopolysaccharide heptosyltransferase II [Lentisphaerae bacterium]|nr:lipopolysaccharide heptosyltransferase II [Lentisphaerota bacterium]
MVKNIIRQSLDLAAPECDFPPAEVKEFRNGIVVRMPNHLGDAVMALPALAALKNVLPDKCGLFVVAPENTLQLYQTLDFVDQTVTLAQPHRFWSLDERRQVKCLRAGAAVLFNHSFRDAFCFKLCGVPELFGEPTRNRGFLLKGKFPFAKKVRGEYSASHQAMRYLAIAEALGGKAPERLMPELKIPCSPDELSGDTAALFYHPMLLTLAPGAAYGAAKRWPHEYYAKVAAYWIRKGGIVALTGSSAEKKICEEIAKELPENKVFNLSGKTDLFSLMYLFRYNKFAITNDSGLMHLASAVGSAGLTVFGPTDLYDTGPVSDKWLMFHEREKCAPCLRRVCPQGNPVCTRKITPFKVIRVMRKELAPLLSGRKRCGLQPMVGGDE